MIDQLEVAGKPATGMADLWAVYEAHHRDLSQAAADAVKAVPELYEVLTALQALQDPADEVKRGEQIRAALKTAMLEGEWTGYLDLIGDTGGVYARAGFDFSVWILAFTGYRSEYLALLQERCAGNLDRFADAAGALGVYTDRTISAIGDQFLKSRQEIIHRQQEAIRELSTPVLKVRPGLLILPLIGIIDTDRARHFTANLLAAVRRERARVVIIDLTGVPAVDSAVANHLLMAAKAARLLGSTAIITGLSTVNAQTLARLGVELGDVRTLSDLETAIAETGLLLGIPAST